VKGTPTYLVGFILLACSPDIDANEAERCSEQAACELGAECYRGFCVPAVLDASADDVAALDPTHDGDAAQGLLSSDSGSVDAAFDASVIADASQADAAEVGSRERPDAGTSSEGPPRVIVDAAAPTPVPGAVSPRCTLKTCCDEANRAQQEGEKRDGRWNWKKGKCGCSDPDLLPVLGCGGNVHAGAQ
jgi:hypothetical protein